MKKIISFLCSRLFLTAILIVIQAIVLILIVLKLSDYFFYIYLGFLLLSFLMVIYIVNKEDTPSFKLPWIILIMAFPILGGFFYLLFGNIHISKKTMAKVKRRKLSTSSVLNQDSITTTNLLHSSKLYYHQSLYLTNACQMPVYQNTETKYLEIGELYFETLCEELKKAEHFIFMEYFIVQEGKMWNTILDILKQKVEEGIEVRVLYDDIGCIGTLPSHYAKTLHQFGIKAIAFNPFVPVLSILHNNRDHRKITVIDGKIGFTGGINLADEYINAYPKHGHWKDTGVLLKGDAVSSLTVLFLDNWNFFHREESDYSKYVSLSSKESHYDDGFVQPFGDSPFDLELISETVYLNIINQATDYVYINTPYLIVDFEMMLALCSAAKRGVDVRIATPHVADKWYVHLVTQSHYQDLIEAGVKIYEYTPGFLHAKSFVADDVVGVIGTINLDYRSLCHHYECGVWLYQCACLKELKKDYLKTIQKCQSITLEFCRNKSLGKRFLGRLLRFVSPLM